MKSYSELKKLKTFEERFEYLKLDGVVGQETFGYDRHINQALYTSDIWKKTRREVIIRDKGWDLGVDGWHITERLIVHHINPITLDDILENRNCVFDLDNLICTSHKTHNAIHYSDENILPRQYVGRKPNDTCPWKN